MHFLQPHDRVLLEKTYRYGSDVVHDRLNYFSNYYYAYADIAKGDMNSQQIAFIKINADTSTMLTTILGFNRHICGIGGSTDDNFVERLPRVLWAMQHVYRKRLGDIYLPSLYLLANLEQALTEYIFSSQQKYKEKAKELLKEVEALTSQFEENGDVKKVIESNLQLSLFLTTQKIRTNSALGNENKTTIPNVTEVPNLKTENKLRILTSLCRLDKDQFIKQFEQELPSLIDDIYRSMPG